MLLQDQGKFAAARPLHERALAISEKVLIFCEAALDAHEKTLGQDHPWTKDSASVSADALAALSRTDEAAALRARFGLERNAPPSV
jgi:hypothetical protein